MAAGVAHELRNPLTSVKLLIQAAAQRPDRVMTEKQYRVVLDEVSRMQTTIEQLLEFARPPRMNRSRRDLREIAQTVVGSLAGLAGKAGANVVIEAPDQPVDVDADPEQLRQVFSNLIQNALEAMPEDGCLRISIEPGQRAAGHGPGKAGGCACRVIFADNGPGISPAVAPRLFEPFVTDKARGTGLGLAICLRIVKDHGGSLTAVNRDNGGAVFTLELPGAAPTVSPADEHSSPDRAFRQPILEHAHAEATGSR